MISGAGSNRSGWAQGRVMFGGKTGFKFKIRMWVERNGVKVLGPGRIELMELIDRLRSISAAAKQMDMSYRRAWGLVRSINSAAGETLIEVATGGAGGGGAHLTDHGRAALMRYRQITQRLARTAAQLVGEDALV